MLVAQLSVLPASHECSIIEVYSKGTTVSMLPIPINISTGLEMEIFSFLVDCMCKILTNCGITPIKMNRIIGINNEKISSINRINLEMKNLLSEVGIFLIS